MTIKLEPTATPFQFSFIVTTRNNPDELKATVESISAEAPADTELVVVDGSDKLLGREAIQALISSPAVELAYTVDDKCGVYEAMNVGVVNTHGRWLIMVPAGDRINSGARRHLESLQHSSLDAIVFAQDLADPSGKVLYSFFPTSKSNWPHQSVILKRTVHETFGLYPTEYRYSSDQHFFALVRRGIRYEIRREVFSTFLLGGISSGASLKRSREFFALRRKLGNGLLSSAMRAYVFPYVRSYLERRSGFGGLACKVRVWALRGYQQAR